MAQITNNRTYVEVGEEFKLKGVNCVCKEQREIEGCGKCVLRYFHFRDCYNLACRPNERPDGKFVIFIQK